MDIRLERRLLTVAAHAHSDPSAGCSPAPRPRCSLAAACGGDDGDDSADATDDRRRRRPTARRRRSGETLTLGYSAWPGWFPLAVAEEAGIFEEDGLDVELRFFADYLGSLDAMAAGQLDGNTQTLNDTMFASPPAASR